MGVQFSATTSDDATTQRMMPTTPILVRRPRGVRPLHRQRRCQQRQHQADAQQPADIDAVDDRLTQRRAQDTLQPECTLLRDRAQKSFVVAGRLRQI